MRIATLNTWKQEGDYARRLDAMARALAGVDADAVLLQECFVCEEAGADTAAYLAAATGHLVTRAPMRAKLRPFAGRELMSRSDLAILTRSPPSHAWKETLETDPRDGERLALWADVEAWGQGLRLVNVHFTHLRDAAAAQVRARQVQQAVGLCDDPPEVAAAVIGGDFNDAPGAPALAALAGDARADMRHALAGFAEAMANPGAKGRDALAAGAIDHIIPLSAGRRLRVASRRVVREPAGFSDHPVIVCELDLT